MTSKWDIIYADPPWAERGGGKTKRGADNHYPLMRTDDICGIPVQDMAADNSHLYLWVTNNFLPDGLRVMDAWGFRYITIITWLKGAIWDGLQGPMFELQTGLGQYFRGCTEHCLFGVNGRLPYRIGPDGKRAQGKTGFFAPRYEHSQKPEKMREMIELVSGFPDARKLELFARRKTPGWDTIDTLFPCTKVK